MSNNVQAAPTAKHTRKHGGTPNLLHIVQRRHGRCYAECGEVWTQDDADAFLNATYSCRDDIYLCPACDATMLAKINARAKNDRVAKLAYGMLMQHLGMQ